MSGDDAVVGAVVSDAAAIVGTVVAAGGVPCFAVMQWKGMVVDQMEREEVMWVELHLVLVVFVERMEKMELLLVVLRVVVLLKHWVQPNEMVEMGIVRTVVVMVVVVYDVHSVYKRHLIQVVIDVEDVAVVAVSLYVYYLVAFDCYDSFVIQVHDCCFPGFRWSRPNMIELLMTE